MDNRPSESEISPVGLPEPVAAGEQPLTLEEVLQQNPEMRNIITAMDGGGEKGPASDAFKTLTDTKQSTASLVEAAAQVNISYEEIGDILSHVGHSPATVNTVVEELRKKGKKIKPSYIEDEEKTLEEKENVTLRDLTDKGKNELGPIVNDLQQLVANKDASRAEIDEKTQQALKAVEKFLAEVPEKAGKGLVKLLLFYLPIAIIVSYVYALSRLPKMK